MQYRSIDLRILKLVCCLTCKYLWKWNIVFDEWYRPCEYTDKVPFGEAYTNNKCFQTVTEDMTNVVTEHHEGKTALHGQSVFIKDPWVVLWRRRAQWYYFASEMSSVSSTPDVTNLNWRTRWQWRVTQISLAFKQASPTRLCYGFFDSLQSVHHTYVRPTRGYKQGTAGAKQRQSSCSTLPTDQSLLEQ